MEHEAGKHVRESMQLVENAVLERDQVNNRFCDDILGAFLHVFHNTI